MAFQLSPGVNVTEIDLTTVVPAVSASVGAIGGVFRWGPIGQRVLVDSESTLVSRFGPPTSLNAETFFTAANFLSYTNSLYVSRAANTTGSIADDRSFTVTANTIVSNNILVGNTSGLFVGMYITQTSNSNAIPAGSQYYITAVNATAVILNSGFKTTNTGTTATATVYLGRSETAYTAVGLGSNGAANALPYIVSNLVNQIVKNDNAYLLKDGNFDKDIAYLAKYPGAMGNSLRVSVCDNSNSFSSNVALSNSTVYTAIEFRIGSAIATVKFAGISNTSTNTVANNFSIGDQILAGNSAMGLQYLQVKTVEVGSNALFVNTAVNVFFGNDTFINAYSGFITVPNNAVSPYSNGDVVTYANSAGNTTLSGLTGGASYYVVESNTSGFKLSNTAYGNAISAIGPASGSDFTLTSNTNVLRITFDEPFRLRENYVSETINRNWEFFSLVGSAPGQSTYQYTSGNTAANDEVHVVVVDSGGMFSGVTGTVLEAYKGLSRATDAVKEDGTDNYYKTVVNKNSNYVWWANDRTNAVSNTAVNLVSSNTSSPLNAQFTLGNDGKDEINITLACLGEAYDLFSSPQDVDISLVLQGRPIGGSTVVGGQTVSNFQLANYIIDNICETRRDCIALISPDKATMLNNYGNEATSLKNWRGAIRSTSYAVLDSGYKYQYDRYNDVDRWIPLNGDIGGLCARTDQTNDAWWSPAGYNRGNIKNALKLAYNPKKNERDILYTNGINPVISAPGQGVVLYGDKTLQAKPSAFDRINVRRLFIVLEKAISTAANYSLFEFNDSFTRAQFKNLVTPYLRTIKGRRGITDFYVVCDDTNNTQQIIDTNQFVGDIYIKPARSINYIQLNFVAVPSGVQFSEVVGKF
jgi:phage tail sheath protein FI